MTHSTENTTLATHISDLSEEERETIIEDLCENPTDTVTIDTDNGPSAIYFGVLEMEDRYVAISYDRSESMRAALSFGAGFETEEEAEAEAEDWARRTSASVESECDERMDEEWERFPDASKELVSPFVFRDNTDHINGYEMDDLDDVFIFFCEDEGLFEPENWGNQYFCSLLDANGMAFWVVRNSAGEMKAYKE